MGVNHLLHPLAKVDLPLFIDDFHPKIKVTLNQNAFNFALVRSPHFSFDGPSSMVYELLQNCFVPNVSTSGFNLFLRYVGTLLKVMFHFQYPNFFFHLNSQIEKTV